MRIHLNEITETGTSLHFTESEAWVTDSITALDENPIENSLRPPRAPAARPADLQFQIRKVDEVVVISGSIKTSVNLLCSRCATPFKLPIEKRFSALFCKDPVLAGMPHFDKHEGKVVGQNHGYARHEHNNPDFSANKDMTESSEDLDMTYIAEEYVELANVISEQIQILIPFQPLCKEDCKGVCANCGADLNTGKCACSRLAANNPFEALGTLASKLKANKG